MCWQNIFDKEKTVFSKVFPIFSFPKDIKLTATNTEIWTKLKHKRLLFSNWDFHFHSFLPSYCSNGFSIFKFAKSLTVIKCLHEDFWEFLLFLCIFILLFPEWKIRKNILPPFLSLMIHIQQSVGLRHHFSFITFSVSWKPTLNTK